MGLLVASLLLSGCVDADLGINFKGQSGGEIIQRIKLSDQLTTFNGSTTQQWLSSIKRQASQLQGQAKQSEREIDVTIPFDNGADLEAKLNQFFSSVFQTADTTSPDSQSPLLQSHLQVNQRNFLFLLRHRLVYEFDLRSLGLQSASGDLLLNPAESLLNLNFSLTTPWGARSTNPLGISEAQGRRLIWHLQPGQLNHLEAVFWFPSPLGIGAVLIALVTAGGAYLKYNMLPARSSLANPSGGID